MPKNTTGGSRHKKMANKSSSFVERDYKISSDLEIEAYVEKIIGNGRIQVNSIDGKHTGLICTIRGKFKGRNKSRNRIETNGIIIVGLRDWEAPTYKTCDLLFVCNGKHKLESNENDDDDCGVVFTNDIPENDVINEFMKEIKDDNQENELDIGGSDDDEIDFDDI
jgi:translation initiation factor IF-1